VTLSGGTLSGSRVVRFDDPGRIEVGATVELRDGRQAKVIDVKGKRLSRFGATGGEVTIQFDDGGAPVKVPSAEIARVLPPQRIERGQIPGGEVTGELVVQGQMTGDAHVRPGARLWLFGQIAGTVTVDSGASAEIRGMVVGDVINRGEVTIAGVVTGALRDESGTARVEPGARIG
jgi:hypothetical protein